MAYRKADNKAKHPQIIVAKFGRVNDQTNSILEIMEECYSRLKPHQVDLVDLYLFEKSSTVNAFMAKDFKEIGIESTPSNNLFFAMHDAYKGTPRIVFCLERMEKLPTLVKIGGIRHEVGHSILHGSLQYYLLPRPPSIVALVNRFNVSKKYANKLLYFLAIAVKDYEVSRLLHAKRYIDDQLAYAKHMLSVTEIDKLSWKMSSGQPLAEILCLFSYLKAIGCATPFLFNKTLCQEMKLLLKKSLSHLSTNASTALLNIALKGFPSLGTQTLTNINQFTHFIMENVAVPLLLR